MRRKGVRSEHEQKKFEPELLKKKGSRKFQPLHHHIKRDGRETIGENWGMEPQLLIQGEPQSSSGLGGPLGRQTGNSLHPEKVGKRKSVSKLSHHEALLSPSSLSKQLSLPLSPMRIQEVGISLMETFTDNSREQRDRFRTLLYLSDPKFISASDFYAHTTVLLNSQ